MFEDIDLKVSGEIYRGNLLINGTIKVDTQLLQFKFYHILKTIAQMGEEDAAEAVTRQLQGEVLGAFDKEMVKIREALKNSIEHQVYAILGVENAG